MVSNAALTDQQVLELRNEVRATRSLKLREHATVFGVSHPTILYAIVGKTYAHVPGALLPDEYDRHRGGRVAKMTVEQIDQLVEMRKSNAGHWTYCRLAQFCNTKYGLHYGPSNVKRILEKKTGESIARPASAVRAKSDRPKTVRVKALVAPKAATTVATVATVTPEHPVFVARRKPIPIGYREVDISSRAGRNAIMEKLMAARKINA